MDRRAYGLPTSRNRRAQQRKAYGGGRVVRRAWHDCVEARGLAAQVEEANVTDTREGPDLLPCPHCGGVATLARLDKAAVEHWHRYGLTEGDWRLGCERHDCPDIVIWYSDEIPDAIAAWNTRRAVPDAGPERAYRSMAEFEEAFFPQLAAQRRWEAMTPEEYGRAVAREAFAAALGSGVAAPPEWYEPGNNT